MARRCYLIEVTEGEYVSHYVRKANNHEEAIEIGKRLGVAAKVEAREISREEYLTKR